MSAELLQKSLNVRKTYLLCLSTQGLSKTTQKQSLRRSKIQKSDGNYLKTLQKNCNLLRKLIRKCLHFCRIYLNRRKTPTLCNTH